MFTFQKSGFTPTPVSQSIVTLDVTELNNPTYLMDSSHEDRSLIASGSNVNLNTDEISPMEQHTIPFENM